MTAAKVRPSRRYPNVPQQLNYTSEYSLSPFLRTQWLSLLFEQIDLLPCPGEGHCVLRLVP